MVTLQQASTPLDQIPPHLVLREVLGAPMARALFDYACASEARFKASPVRGEDGVPRVDAELRNSVRLRDLATFEPLLRSIVHARADELMGQLGMSSVETAPFFETELVAHGDGAYFTRHTDIARRDPDTPEVRVLSGVYYVHRVPKAFSGGELRLFSLSARRFVDVAPAHDTLVLFSSWARHEVRPVSSPSRRFEDARFSVSCWVYARLPQRKGDI